MASGKSSVGRSLAVRRSLTFVDTDALIVERHGPIQDIFEARGEAEFRQMERNVASELEGTWGLVVATGGRMMLDEHCAQVLGSTGRIFCLQASLEEIQRRYRADENGPVRPLLAGSDEARLRTLYEERADAYSRFEQVETDGKSVEEVVEDIESRLSDE
jgi:shikimate kinase